MLLYMEGSRSLSTTIHWVVNRLGPVPWTGYRLLSRVTAQAAATRTISSRFPGFGVAAPRNLQKLETIEQPEFVPDFDLHWPACYRIKLRYLANEEESVNHCRDSAFADFDADPVMTEPLGQRTAIDSLWW
jgi:hypothetical protein